MKRYKEDMKQLAICIPTYNQPEMIREMCIRCLNIYRKWDVELNIYDSSPGKETEEIISGYKAEYGNISYKHCSPEIQSNLKVLEAYKEILATGKYEYLWLCPDYIQFTEEGLRCVLRHCSDLFDICVLNYRDVEHIGEKEYSDIDDFFVECAWHMSSYMATVIRTSSFADVDWEYFYKRYTTPNRINHSHVAFYLEHLAKLQTVKAIHIPISSVHMRVSTYRKESMWKEAVFPVWGEYWPDTIRALPQQYRHKDEVIRKLGVNTGIFGWDNFVKLRGEKIYDRKIYHRYRNIWKTLTDVPNMQLYLLAIAPAGMVKRVKSQEIRKKLLLRRLQRFAEECSEILIYGCGFMAGKTSALLDQMGIKYRGYVVSDCSDEKKELNGFPVIGCEELVSSDKKTGIVVALSRENTVQVLDSHNLDMYQTFLMYPYEEALK